MQLLDLDDGCLAQVVSKLGLARRTLMCVCKRLRDIAQNAVHSHQAEGQSVMDAVELAQPGDTVHLLPGYYKARGGAGRAACSPGGVAFRGAASPRVGTHLRPGLPCNAALLQEALLLKKPLHLTCDGGVARILSPARFAVFVAGSGCCLENLVLKSHQVGCGLEGQKLAGPPSQPQFARLGGGRVVGECPTVGELPSPKTTPCCTPTPCTTPADRRERVLPR